MSDATESATIDPVDETLNTTEQQVSSVPIAAVTPPAKAETAKEEPYRIDNPLYDLSLIHI